MPLILGTNSIKDTGYNVANSLRFNDGDSPSMSDSISSNGNAQFSIFSCWVKRGVLGTNQTILNYHINSSHTTQFGFNSDDKLIFHVKDGGSDIVSLISNAVFRDTSAFYHVMLVQQQNATSASDRIKIMANGARLTLATSTIPSTLSSNYWVAGNSDWNPRIGFNDGADNNYFDGYLTEVVFLDGHTIPNSNDADYTANANSTVEYDQDSGILKPKDPTGLSFGTNGYYLNFEDSSALGNDAAGSNNFTVTNLTAVDQSTDTCTNNFCTWNPIANYTNGVAFSEGNLVAMSGTNDQWDSGRATMGFSKGKWYFECLFVAGVSTQYIGVVDESCKMNVANAHNENGTTIYYNNGGGEIRKDGSFTSADYGTFSSSEVAGIAIDADNFTISVYKGGSAIVNAYALSTTRTGFLFPMTTLLNNGDGVKVNFGSPPYSESGGNTDANGYGNFSMSVPSGFFSICTKNLAEYG